MLTESLTGLQPSDDFKHPYEEIIRSNCLGMRIFQIMPWRGGIVFQTTVKNQDPECAAVYHRAPAGSLDSYGQVYYRDIPGFLACAIPWTSKPRKLSFQVTADQTMSVYSDGVMVCSRAIDSEKAKRALTNSSNKVWVRPAMGLYGRRTIDAEQVIR